jgi:hypothetical protein
MAKAKKKSDVRIYTKKTRTWSGQYLEFVHFVGEQEFSPLQRILDLRETTDGWSYPLETLKYAYYNLKSEASPTEKGKDKKYRELCQELFDFLHPLVKDKIEAYTSLIKDGFIGFDTLWILFQKGLKVMFLDRGVYVGGVVSNVEYQKNFMGEAFIIHLQTISVGHEGPVLTTAKVAIPAYSTAKAVETLPVRVITSEMEAEFAARAKNILEVTKSPYYAAYVGEGVHRTWMGPVRFLATGRIMLDAKMFKSRNPNYSVLNEDVQDEEDTENFFEANLFTVSPWVQGFSFYAKQWGEFYFDSIKPIAFNDQAFESLVLPETSTVNGLDTKEMIRSLVEQASTNDYKDLIEGKGEGLIFLLHGSPGTGKTMTSEAVADLLRRPLYSVSIGELGTDITELERNLRNILEIATSWNAVLLLDEADIFLEARSTHDVVRNALVGVFLRLLEYYQGVLFLTTNRVKNFDSAFHSRISLALCYPEHQADTRKHIWRNLTRFSNLNLSDSDLDQLATYDINGRQIKNTIRLGLALSKKKDVTLAELEGIIKLTNKFQEAIS